MKLKGIVPRLWRRLRRILLFLFIFSIVYVLFCKWVNPPITITQGSAMIGSWFSDYSFKRNYVAMDEISPYIKLAVIASEDQLFPDHGGFDWASIRKSLEKKNPRKKNRLPAGAGASTISQQVAKNVFLWQGSGWMRYVRKAPEAYFTKMIEWVWGKKRILEVYLNVIEMGEGIYGVEAAAQQYFGKSAKNLTRAEAAQIAACLPNPITYTVKPQSNFVAWKTQWILKQMNNIEDDEDIQKLIK